MIASLDTSAATDEGEIRSANLCNVFYDQALNETLRIYPWNCATKRAVPVRLTDDPAFGYKYAFQLPNDYVRVLSVTSDPNYGETGMQWVVEGGKILCDYSVIYLKYIHTIDNVNCLDSLATNALVLKLALKLSVPLQIETKMANGIIQELEQVVLPAARSIDTFENKELLIEESSWIQSRNYDTPQY